jgi:hypothetical protein
MPGLSEDRCHGICADGGRCARLAVADGWCTLHHPLAAKEKAVKNIRERKARLAVVFGMHDFWCQVAICALMQFVKKVAPQYEIPVR